MKFPKVINVIKIENTEVLGWESAIRGMRNPMNSWEKIDSDWYFDGTQMKFRIGENDLALMQKLYKAGSDHRKYLRFIDVTVDVTAPLYWWKEFDTYKVGTVANSCSTMHKIHSKEFTLDDFSCERMTEEALACLNIVICVLENRRQKFNESKDATYWNDMIQLLPTSYNQRRTVQLNYEVLVNQYFARKDHKLKEWHDYCNWIESLPYFKEICLNEL